MNELVEKLTQGQHPVIAQRSKDVKEFKAQIDRKFVLLKFTDTQGGTELGFQLDESRSSLDGADFEQGTGTVHLVGDLILDYVKLEMVADVDLSNLEGTGQLVLAEQATH